MKQNLKKARSLSDIDLEEISLVDLPANKRKFLFSKSGKPDESKGNSGSMNKKETDLKISIESDGTEDGTKILVNGEEVEELSDFYFSYYKPYADSLDTPESSRISCSYSKVIEGENGFKRTENYHLAKGDNPMDDELKELLAELLGDDFNADEFAKAEEMSENATNAIKAALKSLKEYKDDFPDELTKAVKVLIKFAGYGTKYPEKTSDDNSDKKNDGDGGDVEKSGKKLSKDTVKKLLEMFKTLQSILPEDDTKTEKSADKDDNAVAKKDDANDKSKVEKDADDKTNGVFKELKDLINKMATEGTNNLKELSKAIGEISKRLKVVEKAGGKKRAIEGQDDDPDATKVAKGAGKDGDILWPSLVQADDENDE